MKTFVEFLYPGILFSESEVRQVETRDIERLEIPPGAFAFQFFDRTDGTVVLDGDEIGVTGKRKNLSPLYYPEGETLTVEQVKALPGDHGILISNMQGNGWPLVVRTRRGNFQPFTDNDRIIPKTKETP